MQQTEKLRNEIAQMERDKEATIRAVRAEDKRRHAEKLKKYKEELDGCQKKMGVLELDKKAANRQLEAEREFKQLDKEVCLYQLAQRAVSFAHTNVSGPTCVRWPQCRCMSCLEAASLLFERGTELVSNNPIFDSGQAISPCCLFDSLDI